MAEATAQQVRIERMAYGPEAVGRLESGKTVFVAGAVPGDLVEVAVDREAERYCNGHVSKVLEASPDRVMPECPYAAVCGGGQALCEALLDSATTDACIALLDQAGLRAPVMARLLAAIDGHVRRRVAGAYPVGVLLFSNVYGVLGQTEGYEEVLHEWKEG